MAFAGNGSGLFKKGITAVSFGLALHYNEIQNSWKDCGTDSLCKAEKVLLYMTVIFGISSPSVLLTQVTKNLANKGWVAVRGIPLLDKTSYWVPTIMSLGIYYGIESQLSSWWTWVKYATDCLKIGVCENDDILIWIHNMKARHCNKTELDMSEEVEMDCVEGECHALDNTDVMSKLRDTSDWCVVLFNELPLLGSSVVIWILYLISVNVAMFNDNDDETDDGDQQNDNGGAKGTDDKGDSKGTDGKGDSKGTDGKGDSKGTDGKGDSKGTDGQGDSKGKDDKGDSMGKCKKRKPTESSKKSGSEKRNESQDEGSTTQIIQVTCPLCKKSRSACIPKPLLVYCKNCGANLGSKSNNTDDVEDPTNSTNQKTGGNETGIGNNPASSNLLLPNPNLPALKVDMNGNVTCLEKADDSSGCISISECAEADLEEMEIYDEDELNEEYKKLADSLKNELKSIQSKCKTCSQSDQANPNIESETEEHSDELSDNEDEIE